MVSKNMVRLVWIAAWACMCGQSPAEQTAGANAPVVLTQVDGAKALPDGVEVKSGSAVMRVTALSDDMLRVQVGARGAIPTHYSWAVVPEAAKLSAAVTPTNTDSAVGFTTRSLKVRIERSPLRLVITDSKDTVLDADDPRHPIEFHGDSFSVHKAMPADEHFFGLGDKMGPLDRRDRAFSLWNTDAYHFQESTDPLYKAIPFFMATHDGLSYGIFLDNTWRTSFDFGREFHDAYSFGAEGGELDYYFLAGPNPKQVMNRYTELTGHIPLPPLWTLGFQQCRYSYYPEAQVREIANRLRADKIPVDTIYLDIDYQEKYRPFTVSREYFPHFEELVQDLKKQHFHLITITDLHIASLPHANYAPYDSGVAGDHFVKKPDGSIFVGIVWPGPAVFPDFTRKVTRDWWGTLYREFYVKDGVAAFWNDMDEPSVFDGPGKTMPLDTVHRIAEPGWPDRSATHAEIHNVVGMQNSRGTYDGLLALKPDQRPFVLTRASFAGGQRYAATWTGDNSATWNHMRLSTPQLLSLGLSGFSMAGDDIGGFAGNAPPELLTRWYELGAFNPIDRNHSEKGAMQHEAWSDGPVHEAIRRRYIEERYRLMPYLYTLAEEASSTGVPMMRPLFMEFPSGDPLDLAAGGAQFMLGRSLMVAPNPFPETLGKYSVTFPVNTTWYDYWTGKTVPAQAPPPGPTPAPPVLVLDVDPKLDTLPVFVRAGSILPRQPLVQSTDEKPQGALELRVYPGPECEGSLYLDDGSSFAYQKGEFLRGRYSCKANPGSVDVEMAREGSFTPWWQEVEVRVFGAPHAPKRVTVNGQNLVAKNAMKYDAGAGTVLLRVKETQAPSAIHIEY